VRPGGRITMAINGTLFIDTVQRSADEGTYTCTARNKHNFTSHRSVEVRVLGKQT